MLNVKIVTGMPTAPGKLGDDIWRPYKPVARGGTGYEHVWPCVTQCYLSGFCLRLFFIALFESYGRIINR